MNLSLAILRETKVPPERRTPLIPEHAAEAQHRFPGLRVVLQPSADRCYEDNDYATSGILIQKDISACTLLLGIKEVRPEEVQENATYLIFSHTLKKQPYNQRLMREMVRRKVTLIDYETLVDAAGQRIIGFGRFAGIVGAYNALLFYGQRTKTFTLPRAYACKDLAELTRHLKALRLPPLRIILTGTGRVGAGAAFLLEAAGAERVSPADFLSERRFPTAVYAQLASGDYHRPLRGGAFDGDQFHTHPGAFAAEFLPYAHRADVLVAGAYWNPAAPRLFTREQMADPAFRIRVIADISCDVNGSIPSTVKSTTVNDPVFDFEPHSGTVLPPFSSEEAVTVMAIDNLPCELPRDASAAFSRDLVDKVLPSLLKEDSAGIIARAKILDRGALTTRFGYLGAYAGIESR